LIFFNLIKKRNSIFYSTVSVFKGEISKLYRRYHFTLHRLWKIVFQILADTESHPRKNFRNENQQNLLKDFSCFLEFYNFVSPKLSFLLQLEDNVKLGKILNLDFLHSFVKEFILSVVCFRSRRAAFLIQN